MTLTGKPIREAITLIGWSPNDLGARRFKPTAVSHAAIANENGYFLLEGRRSDVTRRTYAVSRSVAEPEPRR